jgi:hypothetical protein
MPTWDDIKRGLNDRKGQLDSSTTPTQVDNIGNSINTSIKQFADNAGISKDSTRNQAQVDANAAFNSLIQKELDYKNLIQDLTRSLKGFSDNSDIRARLNTIGSLNNDIRNLESELNKVRDDADISITRKEAVENPDKKVSMYQGFASRVGFTKPLHQISIILLIGFGVLLLILSGLIMKEIFNVESGVNINQYEVFSMFSDSRMYAFIGALILVIVVLGILAYNGYLGKSNL